ncbi:MAG: acetate--CoA ligase [Candidatus Eisenbacteria bacterium]|nr:acetate--CoA ligase [Candidatus Latescibacterota bacterium]MBD3301180.1 acetate--CoA ligase [Candidatus Eisenbacteria bacterium]
MSNIGSYEERRKSFDWKEAERELGYPENGNHNIAWYCVDRHCEKGRGGKTALIWEGHAGEEKRFTFDDLRLHTNAFAARFRELGVEPGERICLFMDKIPELYFSFLGGLKMGGIVQPLFSAFGEDSLITRLEDAETRAIVTTKKHVRKVRRILDRLPHLQHILVVDADGFALKDRETAFDYEKAPPVETFPAHAVTPESPSVLHYTSGTTGKPKGALHVHGSLVSQYITTKWVLDLQDDDIYWCTADPGWVTGTSYGIIGPWSNGCTQLVLDSGFGSARWYEFMQKHRATVWYSAPTAIRLLMRDGTELVQKHDLSSLRHLASVGEPLNAEAVVWSKEAFGKEFHDTYWQTETGCMVLCNYPGLPVKPGSMGKPFPGIEAGVVDPKNHEPVKQGTVGLIALRPGWPSMFRAYWNNEKTYNEKFQNGWYICGDRASIDEDGYYWFVGRDDDVINTGGHLVGPFEIESALIEHEAVAESAAVGKPDKVNMEVVKAFVALKPGFEPNDDTELSIMNFIRKKLSPLAMPQEIEFVPSLPKTRSGKILRRMLRAKEWGEEIGDTSTLEDD